MKEYDKIPAQAVVEVTTSWGTGMEIYTPSEHSFERINR